MDNNQLYHSPPTRRGQLLIKSIKPYQNHSCQVNALRRPHNRLPLQLNIMPRTSANVNMQDHQSLNNMESQLGRQPANVLSSRGQGRYHPYSKSTITQGALGKPTVFKVSTTGRKDHPEWPFRGSQYGDAELRSSDGVSFWVSLSSCHLYITLTLPIKGSTSYAHGFQQGVVQQD